MSLDAVCEQMGHTPPWAEGLILTAIGFFERDLQEGLEDNQTYHQCFSQITFLKK